MKEKYLHYVWENRLFHPLNLYTSKKEKVEIIFPGTANKENGPDYLNALITIGGVMWAGNIEIHVKSSDWRKHRHQFDKEYNQVILHVVLEQDEEVLTEENKLLPTLELKHLILNSNSRIDENKFEWNKNLPCAGLLKNVQPEIKNHWLKICGLKRIQQKSEKFSVHFSTSKSKEESLYESIAAIIMAKANSLPMQELQNKIAYSILQRHRNSITDLFVLYLGTAGLLKVGNKTNASTSELYLHYSHLKRKYQLTEINTRWKTGGIRPGNRAEIRIIQHAFIFYCFANRLINPVKIYNAHDWLNEFSKVKKKLKSELERILPTQLIHQLIPGKSTRNTLLINCIIPFQMNYPAQKLSPKEHEQEMQNRLKKIKAEKNYIVNTLSDSGFKMTNALETQGGLHLFYNFCQLKKCMECAVGKSILS